MTFVEQGAKQPVLSCFLTETSSLALERSLLEEHSKVQDSFTVCVPDCKSKGSTADGSSSQSAASLAIPHWMSSKQEMEVKISNSTNNGYSTNMAISKPQTLQENSHSHSQKYLEPFGTLSVPSIGIEAERLSVVTQSRADESNSKHLFQKQLPSLSVSSRPPEDPSREEQKENSKVDLISFLLQKQQKQVVKECPKALPGLPLGHHGGKTSDKKSEVSSWVSKFPFQIGPEADFGQSVELRRSIHHRQFLKPNTDFYDCPTQLAGSKNHNGQSSFLIQHSSSPMGAAKLGLPQKTQVSVVSSTSKWALTETPLGLDTPSLKRDWNATLMQSVKHPQILPDFFAQQKAATAAKVNSFSNCESLSEIKCKDFFSVKDSASRVGEEIADSNRNFSVSHQYMEQQEQACGRVARGNLSHNSSLQVNMVKVKVEASSEDFEASRCAKSATRESMGKNCKTGDFEGKFSPAASQAARQLSCVDLDVNKAMSNSQATELLLFAECASTQLLGNSSNVSAIAPSRSFLKQPSNFKGLEKGKTVPEGDWGEFLAGSKLMQAAETHTKIMLPFQQRFEQLQEYLRKCDGSDKEYCWRAFHMLSASTCSDHAAELESRALRLSLEEGKELKRAKLLNVLEEVPEGAFLTACARPMGPCFLSPKGTTVVKEEAR